MIILVYFHKDLKKSRFSQIHNKEGFKKILIKRTDSHSLSQVKIKAYKQSLDKWVDMGTYQYYSKMRLSRQFHACLFFFYEKILRPQKAPKCTQATSTLLKVCMCKIFS